MSGCRLHLSGFIQVERIGSGVVYVRCGIFRVTSACLPGWVGVDVGGGLKWIFIKGR